MGDKIPELVISYNQVRFPVGELGHQPSTKPWTYSFPCQQMSWGKGETEFVGMASHEKVLILDFLESQEPKDD